MLRIGWLSTGRDEAARRLLTSVLEAIDRGELKAELSFVFCNREPGEDEETDRFLDLVRKSDIPLVCLSSRKFRNSGPDWRERYDREVIARIMNFGPPLCVLSGYMLIVSRVLCQELSMINLHPAPPGGPSGTWQEVIWQLIGSGAEKSGVMMHVVTPELDQGPPVTYCTFPLQGGLFDVYRPEVEKAPLEIIKRVYGESFPLFRLIRREGVKREIPLMVATLRAFAQGKVRVEGQKVVNGNGEVIPGYDLTGEVEAALEREG